MHFKAHTFCNPCRLDTPLAKRIATVVGNDKLVGLPDLSKGGAHSRQATRTPAKIIVSKPIA